MLIIFEKFFWFIYFKIYTLCFISDYVTKVLLVDLSFLFPSCLSPFFFEEISQNLSFNSSAEIFCLHCSTELLWSCFQFYQISYFDLIIASVPYVSLWEVSLCVLEVGFLLSVLCLCALFLWVEAGFLFSVLCLCALFLWVPPLFTLSLLPFVVLNDSFTSLVADNLFKWA